MRTTKRSSCFDTMSRRWKRSSALLTRTRGVDTKHALLLLGITDGGRMLFLVYEQKSNGVLRVYSARDMTLNERRTYRRLRHDDHKIVDPLQDQDWADAWDTLPEAPALVPAQRPHR